MRMILARNLIVLFVVLSQPDVSAQNKGLAEDSLLAREILAKKITDMHIVKLNSNGLKLDLTKEEATRICEIVLYSKYGRFQIRRQKPFHVFRIENYWIMWGHFKDKERSFGGVFEIVLNAQNGSVEYLSHGK
ncbi:NTF2 fold immunity protein [Chryseolinea lacunae]|uniref:NTF2 fold domain-containing protein n=1 Tax=Chryseolinea lacunae TaxID=2801331 RepID=A0ABS1L2K8_9BACT|nr:NTF2 fold immunity protein [Chryseolinea lacunae]MBL0745949.1 hypothetical protein [Chryseolinea lacunae]